MDAGFVPELPAAPATPELDDWLSRVADVTPVIEANRDRAERDRVMPVEVYRELRDAGFTRMWVSKEFGGEQISIRTGMAVVEELARLDASVAWQIGVQGAIGRLSDFLPAHSARELFKNNSGLVIGGVKPFGRAEPVDGGYLLSGTWSFASGSAHAGWLASMAFVTRGGKPVMTPTGPDIRVAFVRPADVELLDTWHTIGLRGTGSNDYRVSELFVPDELTCGKDEISSAPADVTTRGYGLSYYDFGPFTTAPTALGIAQAAFEAFREMAGGKVPASGKTSLAASHTVHEKVGHVAMQLHSSRVLLHEAAAHAERAVESGDDSLSALIRLTGATVGQNAIAAVSTLYELAGSTSIYTGDRLDRCFRDIHAATKHIALSASHFEMVGQYLLTGDLQMRR